MPLNILHTATEKILEGIYPRCCPLCHKIVVPRGALVCPACVEKLKPLEGPRCLKCGKGLENSETEYCGDCREGNHFFDQGLGILPYDDKMKASIMQYKYHGRREYSDFYAAALVYWGSKSISRWRPQAIIPVPLHPKKKRMRGFNQAALLAKPLGEHFGIPVYENWVFRVRKTIPQKELSARERRKNMESAFGAEPAPQGIRRVLLVDDIYTTGSTVDAISRILKEQGIEKVYFLTVCIGKGY